MAESKIRKSYSYNNVLSFIDKWVTGYVVAGNAAHVYLSLHYPYTAVKNYDIAARVFVNNTWTNCTLRSIGTSVQGIDVSMEFSGSNNHYGKALLFEFNGTITLE